MDSPKFIRIGKYIINPLAIAAIYIDDETVFITLLTTDAAMRKNEANTYQHVAISEVIELEGAFAKKAIEYFSSSMFSKKIA